MLRLFFIFVFLFFPFQRASADDINAVKAAVNKNYSVPPSTQVGRLLVEWYKLQQSEEVRFHEATKFLSQNSTWPNQTDIRKKIESSITPNIPTAEVIAWFKRYPPLTSDGMSTYLKALIATKQTAQAMQVLKNWWVDASLTPEDQATMLREFGKYLGSQDHEKRLRTIIHDKYYTASRQLAQQLGHGYPQLVEAKIALIEDKPNANALLSAVPASLKNNEALMLARVQWRRKNNEDAGAIDMLNHAPAYNQLSDPAAWWKERHIMARRLMEEKKWGAAYALVNDHRQQSGADYAQAEFLAGWLALRKIGKPWEAFKHFEKLYNAVKTPISRSRGAYWAGFASDSLGHQEVATQWYQVAAKYQTTFYGQMAAQRINLPLGLLSETPIQISTEARSRFRQNPLIAAALILKQAKQNNDAKKFLQAYNEDYKTGLDYKLTAELSDALGYKDTTVKIAKSAERDGYLMPKYLFPVLPAATQKRYAVHPAFNHGIMRQESAFDQYAQSHAGALGLMQLMPATAKETAGKAGLSYSPALLTNDPSYNMTLGSLYIKQMLDQFDGNRTLAIAAYNAGPGRVRQWIKEFGDPRDPKIDEADWIETIPVYETRNYVQRVTESVNVYARLIK